MKDSKENKDEKKYVAWFENIGMQDIKKVGGKNASLGEMIRSLKSQGISVPDGFATTSRAYWDFIEANNVKEKIETQISEMHKGNKSLAATGKAIRRLFQKNDFPPAVAEKIRQSYQELSGRYDQEDIDVAVRSSATAEDLPDASFAGQQETFLNITGEQEVMEACRKCFASLFTDRAISYREERGFDHMKVALSVGVQIMIRADKAGSGVMFTLDTETGFPDVVVINAAWGLGENVVQGTVTPDEYRIFKPPLKEERYRPIIGKSVGEKEKKMVYDTGKSTTIKNVNTRKDERRALVLNDDEILTLARWACIIEKHYGKPMDIEWAKDGDTGELFILQARPETVQSQKQAAVLKAYHLKESGKKLATGLSIGTAIAAGKALIIKNAGDIDKFKKGGILVTEMTDPDWVPIMKQAAGIVTDHGGRTSHAAIVSRELGVPAIVGTGNGTEIVKNGQEITISCAEGDEGYIYEGILDFDEKQLDLENIPETRTRIMMNIGSPSAGFRWWRLPCEGIGLARMEYIINNIIKIHPMALAEFDTLDDAALKKEIQTLTSGYKDKKHYFVDHLAWGMAQIAAAQYPDPVIVRMSDFKTNEYADLVGGHHFEPVENNPMLGFRGASRYYSDQYRPGFALECRAIKKVREEIGLTNVIMMIPFCRTPEEADRVFEVMADNGLIRGKDGLKVYVMAEVPSNILQAEEFAKRFDGFSIGSNDLTQLTLGVDRDSGELASLFDERSTAVKAQIRILIQKAHEAGRKVGICGQAPSDYPEFSEFLVKEGIDSISLNPDSVISVKEHVAAAEKRHR
ncbi:MAG: phosphoenolpyruvate synthase [Desulfosalsimonadaceae bacterium]